MILRQILQLDQPPGPTAAAVCSVELKHTVAATVGADRVLHCLVFPDGALGELQPKREHLRQIVGCGFDHGGDVLLPQTIHLHAVRGEVFFHLHDRVGIVQPGLFLHSGG